jgi:hypothetical protein
MLEDPEGILARKEDLEPKDTKGKTASKGILIESRTA